MGEDFMPRRLAQIEREGELDRADTWQCHGVEWFAGDQCLGCEAAQVERERIIKLLKANFIDNELLDLAIALIKDKTRNITSEILPDGTIYIEEVEMGN